MILTVLKNDEINVYIYVYRFQEIVPLRASNVLGSENNKVSAKWNSLIRETLNKRVVTRADRDEGINGISQDFKCIVSKQMVGILITVWVRGELRPYIRHPSVSCVGCGVMGCLGNKVTPLIFSLFYYIFHISLLYLYVYRFRCWLLLDNSYVCFSDFGWTFIYQIILICGCTVDKKKKENCGCGCGCGWTCIYNSI